MQLVEILLIYKIVKCLYELIKWLKLDECNQLLKEEEVMNIEWKERFAVFIWKFKCE